MTHPHTADEVARVAKGLTKAVQRAVLCFSDGWMTSSEAGATGMGATLLCVGKDVLAERRWTTWGPDRVNGQLSGEGYEYRLCPLGLAVRNFLQEQESGR